MSARNPLRRLKSVGAKVTWIVAVVSGIAVLLVSGWSGLRGYRHLEEQSVQTVASQARLVGVYSSAALAFGDRETARAVLGALRVVDGVEAAVLVDRDGAAFAQFVAPGVWAPAFTSRPIGRWARPGGYVQVLPVEDRAGVHGRLQVFVRQTGLRREALWVALQTAGLSLAALLLAWWLARRLHPALTDPIVRLERAARRVRDTGDVDVRVVRESDDELGHLTDAFNAMLDRISTTQRDLLAAQQRAEESNRLKDEFLATVSHELRTPLSPIIAWIQMLRLPGAEADLPEGMAVIERNARALVAIVDDLLDVSRIVSGTLRLHMQPVDAHAVIDAAVETLTPAATARDVRVRLALEPVPALLGDPARLRQVVWNLLSNAIKFSATGGEVRVSTHLNDDGSVCIVVADDGAGIDPAFLPHVFDRFRQQDGSMTRFHGGLGLGLSIVRQLVDLHGGSVTAASPGRQQGARFTVCLPAARMPLPAVADGTADAGPVRPLQGRRIVLVEDHADMRAVLRFVLEGAGATLVVYDNANAALAGFASEPTPDLIISDIGLPDLDGYALLEALRRDPRARSIPAIAISAYARPDDRARARRAGFARHLAKPVTPAVLLDAIGEFLASNEAPRGPG